jgi:hypothetical protein
LIRTAADGVGERARQSLNAAARCEAIEDLFAAALTTKEFLFNH